jgi:hypothetical protein
VSPVAAHWLLRLVLAATVVGVAVVHYDDHGRPDQVGILLDRTAMALTRAGFAVERHRESWQGTRATGRRIVVGRHPDCAMPIAIEATGVLNPRFDGGTTYLYGDASGPPPRSAAIARNALAMVLNHVSPWRQSPRPIIKMLAVADPSACLAITSIDWRWVWFGGDPARHAALP